MKIILFLLGFVFLLSVAGAHAQNTAKIDSLKQVIAGSADFDQKHKAYFWLAIEIMYSDPGAAEQIVQQHQEFTRKHHNSKAEARAIENYGHVEMIRGNVPQTIAYFKQALQMSEQAQDSSSIIGHHINLAMAYNRQNDNSKALKHALTALDLCKKYNKGEKEITILGNLGNIYRDLENYEKSIEYYRQALAESRRVGHRPMIARSLTNLAGDYIHQNKFKLALEYLKEAREIFIDLGDYYNLSVNYYTTAKAYAKGYNNLGKAREYMEKGLAVSQKVGNIGGEISALHGLASVNQDLGHYDKAEEQLKEALRLSYQINRPEDIKDMEEGLAGLYEARHDYRNALKSYKVFVQYRDSVNNREVTQQLAQLEKQFEVEKKDKEIAQLNEDKALKEMMLNRQTARQYQLIGIIGFVAVVALGLLLAFRHKQRSNQKLQKAYTDLEHMQEVLLQKEKSLFAKQLAELELKALRAQMNPHFIFNCLNAIQSLILLDERDNAVRYLQKFSRLIRMILDNSQKSFNSLADEATILQLYLELEALRMEEHFSYSLEIDPELDTECIELPSMVLQPLAENAIWHGLMPLRQGAGHLNIRFFRTESGISCRISDTGIGLEMAAVLKESRIESHTSKGLELIRQRLESWSRTRPVKATLELKINEETGQGTVAEVLITTAVYA